MYFYYVYRSAQDATLCVLLDKELFSGLRSLEVPQLWVMILSARFVIIIPRQDSRLPLLNKSNSRLKIFGFRIFCTELCIDKSIGNQELNLTISYISHHCRLQKATTSRKQQRSLGELWMLCRYEYKYIDCTFSHTVKPDFVLVF